MYDFTVSGRQCLRGCRSDSKHLNTQQRVVHTKHVYEIWWRFFFWEVGHAIWTTKIQYIRKWLPENFCNIRNLCHQRFFTQILIISAVRSIILESGLFSFKSFIKFLFFIFVYHKQNIKNGCWNIHSVRIFNFVIHMCIKKLIFLFVF